MTHWHEDHAGNATALVGHGVPILLAPKTESILRTRPAIPLYRRLIWGRPPALAREVVPFSSDEFECIPTPGHSEDHQVVWFPDTKTLFSGDLWLGVRSRVFHRSEDPYRIVESLRRVATLEPARMFDAHRGLVTRPAESLLARADWLSKKLHEIEEQLAQGCDTNQIVESLLGGEELAGIVSRGEYSRRNLVLAVHRRVELTA